ncbi:MAG: lipoprotein-releasing ABC transporter ATP-binding protein LolD [Gammaproteobacteria bacterium]|nr:lipoprotein-releasing ABC transporter ATP-binding protein LolD [Gammaproteobacteria bacterium]
MSNIVLECRDLSKSYFDGAALIQVLQGVNLQVQAGEMIAVIGNSGSGKSTLMHLLGGLDKPSSGNILIKGKNIAALSETEKCDLRNRNLGFVYQFHHLLPEFTALENVCMPLLIGNMDPKMAEPKAEHILELVGLKERLTHKISELSGGERQRVAIARALVIDPLCILADEPTGNLDPKNAERVFQLFLDLQKACQTSVVIVTHDIRLAEQTQRMLKIENGELVLI